ncbi:tetratricopeptide repeat protein [Streptomyces sp. AN091965]|uniref:tetratricopeptide repeat protein n=1 Tax=Streptomyces sp. AN091965 TaxID=2927803 RepID=UPI001F62559E|nr:tetratricopeptide repeat protein [Streptomyces sp. AN091965]MCI3931313.1 tetratricopeptide repeat protein [Streptomyces sp. AN091965]
MTEPSMQELIRRRRRSGFVGRRGELAAFRGNFDVPVTDERHRFLFHVHGNAGVGKTSLVREMEQIARQQGALTACTDEAVGSVPEVMAAVSAEFARRGRRCKELDRMLATHRERRHEAEMASLAATADPGQDPGTVPPPSAGSMTAARAGLAGLGLLPGVGAFTGAVDPAQLAQGADRLRAGLSARFRNQEDVQLVLSPERVLTPVFLGELAEAARAYPWVVLFFDTYERTGPFLDGWLCDLMTTDRYGALPAHLVVVTAGQQAFDAARWDGYLDFMADVPLEPFTDLEARGLLAGKGVTAEPVVEEVLRLSGGLPVLVSTLAESRPTGPDGVGDPCATAVERFLKWEPDPVRRAVALACALPRGLDEDVVRAAVDGLCAAEEVPDLFAWLRKLPFVSDRGDRLGYHDVVRDPMLRLQRQRSPRGWAERHGRLAETFGAWRAETGAALDADAVWADGQWRELRLAESYHLLCAGGRTALPDVLRDVVSACNQGESVARQWARVLADAGSDSTGRAAEQWGRDLLAALGRDDLTLPLGLLIDRGGLDRRGRALAHAVRGRFRRQSGALEDSLADYDRAVALDPELMRAYRGRASTHGKRGDYAAGLADLDRADALVPDQIVTLRMRGEFQRILGHYEKAVDDLGRAIELAPGQEYAWASRGAALHSLGRHDEALRDFDRALELKPEYTWALVKRARLHLSLGRSERALADLDRAVVHSADWAWVWGTRGDTLRVMRRYEEALVDYDRALGIDDGYASGYAGRGAVLLGLDRPRKALADLDRALGAAPDRAWTLAQRSRARRRLGDHEGALADADRAVELWPDSSWARYCRARVLVGLYRYEDALADLDRIVGKEPGYGDALVLRGRVHSELGLHEQALADLDRAVATDEDRPSLREGRCFVQVRVGRLAGAAEDLARLAARGERTDWACCMRAALDLMNGRPDLALAGLAADDGAATRFVGGADALAQACRLMGRWPQARAAASALRAHDEALGALAHALAVSGGEGAGAARTAWQDADRLLRAGGRRPAEAAYLGAVVAAGLADWTALDARLARCVPPDDPRTNWADRVELADLLTELLHAPGADRARLAPRLARVAGARDAFRARYAEPGA